MLHESHHIVFITACAKMSSFSTNANGRHLTPLANSMFNNCMTQSSPLPVAALKGWRKKRPEHLHALFTRAVEMNQCKSIYVMTKHFHICVGIFA